MATTAEGQGFPGKCNSCEIFWLPKFKIGKKNYLCIYSSKVEVLEIIIWWSPSSPNVPLGHLHSELVSSELASLFRRLIKTNFYIIVPVFLHSNSAIMRPQESRLPAVTCVKQRVKTKCCGFTQCMTGKKKKLPSVTTGYLATSRWRQKWGQEIIGPTTPCKTTMCHFYTSVFVWIKQTRYYMLIEMLS